LGSIHFVFSLPLNSYAARHSAFFAVSLFVCQYGKTAMKSVRNILVGGVLLLGAAHAGATENGQREVGDATQAWFAMQAEGSQAGVSAPMPGVQASAAYTRYLKSFDKPIPEHFGSSLKDSISGGGASGG
jgi:hypothetical protein